MTWITLLVNEDNHTNTVYSFNLKLRNIVDNLSIGLIVRKQLRPVIFDDGNFLDHVEKINVTPHEIL
jgi:hypothetical protein